MNGECFLKKTRIEKKLCKLSVYINPLVPNAPFVYRLKLSENRKVFWCFQGVEKGYIGNEWINQGAQDSF